MEHLGTHRLCRRLSGVTVEEIMAAADRPAVSGGEETAK